MSSGYVFFREFLNRVKTYDNLKEVYQRGGQPFTDEITCIIESIIKEHLGCNTSREYYRIDVTGWKDRKNEVLEEARKLSVNPHLWDLLVAVEHENNPKDWTDEMIKLAHINCPLKVVIGYSPCDDREAGEQDRLDMVASWLFKTKAFSDTYGEFLLIFGNSSAIDHSFTYDDYDYRGYLLDRASGKFCRILV